ncbi:MAG: MFS transporter [Bacteroidales bacterium]|nr:MFS transporter [Bacteroidales bacterium]
MNAGNPLKWIPTVYFAMGMPFVVLNMVCVLMFKGLDVSDAQVAFWTSLIMLPWTLKPLWSPILEIYKTKRFFIIVTEIITGVFFGVVAFSLHLPDFFAVAIAVLAVIALSGATHDVVTDGMYMQELDSKTQAKYIGWQGAFYNIAKIFATGLLVYLAGVFIDDYSKTVSLHDATVKAWFLIMIFCGLIMILLGIYHFFSLPRSEKGSHGKTLKESMKEFTEVFYDFFTKRHIWYYMIFIILYRFAEGLVMRIVPMFLKAPLAQQGLGMSEKEIGICYGTFGAAAFVLGSILAGYFIARRGLKKSLFILCCVFNFPFVVYTLFALFQPQNLFLIGAGIVFEYFGYGFGFVGLTLFMMQQIAPGKHQMAHYAFASGIMNLGVMLPGMLSGYMSDAFGYRLFFILVLLAIVPSLLITWFVPFSYDEKGEKILNS